MNKPNTKKERKPVERVIYDNYDLSVYEEGVREFLSEQGNEDPSDQEVWDHIYLEDKFTWEEEKAHLEEFFKGGEFIAVGTCGLWHGNYKGGFLFGSLRELMSYLEDCDKIKMWDENGHFYVKASHHDGTHSLEVRKLTAKGAKYIENWADRWDDPRSKKEVHEKVFGNSHYSHILNYAHEQWGCPKRAYEKGE